MKILDKIVKDKKEEILKLSLKNPISSLENQKLFSRKCISLKDSLLRSSSGIICEFKRKSPSNNNINYKSTISEVVRGYQKAGAAALSILTNKKYFDGNIFDRNFLYSKLFSSSSDSEPLVTELFEESSSWRLRW